MSVQIAHYRPVSAGVSIWADTVAWDDGVAVVGAAGATARYREHTAHSEGGGASARGGAALAGALWAIRWNGKWKGVFGCESSPISRKLR